MDAILQQFNLEQPLHANAWMWQETCISDVSLTLVRSVPHIVLPSQTQQATEHELSASSSSSQQLPADGLVGPSAHRHVFQLHASVLCSSSAYFRARITGAVGVTSSGGKRSRVEKMEEVVEAEECEAAASLVQFFYTSKLEVTAVPASACAEFLLQMIKVSPG